MDQTRDHDSPARFWAVLLAAGAGSRLKVASGGRRKQFLELEGGPLFWKPARTLARHPRLDGLVFVFPAEEFLERQELLIELMNQEDLNVPWLAVPGGERRQDSVREGLQALPPDVRFVLVHDAARPFVSVKVIQNVVQALEQGAQAVIPAVPVSDTIKRVTVEDESELVAETPPRHRLRAVQTPQGFDLGLLLEAHEQARAEGWDVTDDASLAERLGIPVTVVPGEEANRKITTAEDLALLAPPAPVGQRLPLVGHGYDVHRFVPATEAKARPLKLGGVPIPGPMAVAAHSDGDVLLHALTDALLGLLGQGDIGQRFPDSDPALEGLESAIFLNEVFIDVQRAGILLTNVDLTIVAQVPKIGPHRERIRENVARLLRLPPRRVNVKATTEEGLGFTGAKQGVKAIALVTGLAPFEEGEPGS